MLHIGTRADILYWSNLSADLQQPVIATATWNAITRHCYDSLPIVQRWATQIYVLPVQWEEPPEFAASEPWPACLFTRLLTTTRAAFSRQKAARYTELNWLFLRGLH